MNCFPSTIAGFLGLGATELIVILVILLVLFGGAKLPSLARGIGESIREFKKSSKEEPTEKKDEEKKPDVSHSDASKLGKN